MRYKIFSERTGLKVSELALRTSADAKASEARLLGERCVPTWRCEISSNRHFDDWSGGFGA
jgi:hypothetical protein